MNTTIRHPATFRGLQAAVIVILIHFRHASAIWGETPGPDPAGPAAFQLVVRGQAFEFVSIPAGEYLMGSDDHPREQPIHGVRVPAFGLGKTEVTVRQFAGFTAATGYQTDAERKGGAWKCCWTPSGAH